MAFDETIMDARRKLRESLMHYRIDACELIAIDPICCCQHFDKCLLQLLIQLLKFDQVGHIFNVIVYN